MLVTQQPVLRRFWYPVLPLDQIETAPQSFQLLGENLVLWKDEEGDPRAAKNRCCHRSAQLSQGKIENGNLVCPYHGWAFAPSGNCVRVPQLANQEKIPQNYRISTYPCQARYGYAWVCLEESAVAEIPEIPEASDPNFRCIPEFYEPWRCAGLRVMENELDLAHPTFVHTGTFGSEENPVPDEMEITETDYGLKVNAVLGVVNPEAQQKNLKMSKSKTVRTLDIDWFLPFTCKLRINYPNGLVHIIVNTATPVNDGTSQIVQFCLRNDTETQTKAEDARGFDRAVTLEDKAILETTDYDVPLDLSWEQHMATDKPGMLMRRRFASLLQTYGESEATARKPPKQQEMLV
jgi:phenylpropionate dioxygenase-like ring-hydroxylating dioxygenase large terminal subunit